MARKEKKRPNKRIKTERVGSVTLLLTTRSPYWWMYWTEQDGGDGQAKGKGRKRECMRSTRETDLQLARVVASKKNEQLISRT